MKHLSVEGPSGPIERARGSEGSRSDPRLAALLSLSLEAKLVHLRFRPLYANPAFARLFGFADAADALAAADLSALIAPLEDPGRAWGAQLCGAQAEGAAPMRRRDGARFRARYLARPIQWDGETAVAMAILEDARGPPVLVVSADPAVRAWLCVALARLGREAICAACAETALACLARDEVALALIDLAPPTDGLGLARRVRALAGRAGDTPLAALAARRSARRLAEIAAAGMDGFLPRAPDLAALEQTVRLLGGASVRPAELDQIEQDDHG